MSEETTSPEPTGEPSGELDGINPAVKAEEAKTEESAEKTAEKKAAAAALKKLKVKGKEIEVDESKYHEYAQKGAAATETWQEAAKMRKEADDFMRRLKEDPRGLLTDPSIGVDFRKIAEEYIWEQIQEEQLSPEQKAARDRDRELEKYRTEAQKREQEQAEAQKQQQAEYYRQEFDKRISDALSRSELPKDEYTVDRLLHYLRLDISKGFQQDIGEYVKMVEADYQNSVKSIIGKLNGDQLLAWLGEDAMKKARESDLKRLKTSTPASGHTFVPGKGMIKADAPKKLSGQDWERSVLADFKGR
jgi:hypothetical protein